MDKWTVKTIPKYHNRKWYALHWNGQPLAYLSDGRTMGSYKYPDDARKRAEQLNRCAADRAVVGADHAVQ